MPRSGVVHHITFLVRDALSFLPKFQVSTLSRRKVFIQSLQGFTLCFQLLFPFVWSFFYYRSSSWRFYMMVHQWFNSFSKCSSRFFSEELKFSSSWNPDYNSFTHIFWGGVMSFLIISLQVLWFTSCQEWDVLKTIIFLFDHEVF